MNNLIREKLNGLSYRYDKMSDDDLLTSILSGRGYGEAVFYLLYGRYLPDIEFQCFKIGAKAACLPDLMAELELHLLNNRCEVFRSFNGKSSLKTWFLAVAHNLIINRLPKIESLYSENVELTEWKMPSSITADTDMETLISFRQALCNLSSVEQRIVLIKEVEGYDAKEIAEMLTERRANVSKSARQRCPKVSVDNVYKIRQRAIASLKDLLRKEQARIAAEEAHIRFRMADEEDWSFESTLHYGHKPLIIYNIFKIKDDMENIKM